MTLILSMEHSNTSNTLKIYLLIIEQVIDGLSDPREQLLMTSLVHVGSGTVRSSVEAPCLY